MGAPRVDALTRRRLLRRAGELAAATALVAPASALGAPRVRASQWRRLAAELQGRLLLPGDRGYAAYALPYNHRYAAVLPAGVVACERASDVQAAVRWATANGVPLVPRSGGHSYAGYSTTRGLLITVKPMRAVSVTADGGTARVQAGARNVDIYAGLQPHGTAFSAGRCPSVGVSGLVLGGGFGFSSRAVGLTSDALVSTDIVTADGRLRRCSETENADLFWALRGAGGGNLGFNTSFTFRTTPVDDVTVYELKWSWADAPRALAAMLARMVSAPNALSCRMGAGNGGRRGGNPSFSALGQFFGSPDELRDLLGPVVTAVPPTDALVDVRTFWQAKDFFFHSTPTGRFGVSSAFLDEPLDAAGIDALLGQIARWPGSGNVDGGGAAIFAWGGAIGDTPPDATAFVHRRAAFLLAMDTSWTARDTAATARANLRWLARLSAAMRPYANGFAYQNFIDRSQPNQLRAYYGANLERLVRVKRAVDPADVFHYPQSIPTRL